jgi:hypothetical protein
MSEYIEKPLFEIWLETKGIKIIYLKFGMPLKKKKSKKNEV